MRLARDQRDCGKPPILSSLLTSLFQFFISHPSTLVVTPLIFSTGETRKMLHFSLSPPFPPLSLSLLRIFLVFPLSLEGFQKIFLRFGVYFISIFIASFFVAKFILSYPILFVIKIDISFLYILLLKILQIKIISLKNNIIISFLSILYILSFSILILHFQNFDLIDRSFLINSKVSDTVPKRILPIKYKNRNQTIWPILHLFYKN